MSIEATSIAANTSSQAKSDSAVRQQVPLNSNTNGTLGGGQGRFRRVDGGEVATGAAGVAIDGVAGHSQTAADSQRASAGMHAVHGSVSDRVLDGLTHGKTQRMVAQELGLSLDFVTMVVSQLVQSGRLSIYDLRSCNATTGEGCNPDPESLVCSGCPILPSAIRKRQSIFGRLKTKFVSHCDQ